MGMSLVHDNQKNDTRFDELKERLKAIAMTEGAGRDSRIKQGLALLDAAYEGVIDMQPDKHGKDEDDATYLTADYSLHQRGATMFDTKSDSARVQIAQTRLVIKLGGMTKLGRGEPVNTVNNLMNMRRVMRRDPSLAGKLDNAYVTLLRYARLQLKSDHVIDTEAELRALCLKKPPKQKSIEDKLKAIHKDVDALIKGTMAHGTMQFSCDDLELAREGLKGAIKVFTRGADASEASNEATTQDESLPTEAPRPAHGTGDAALVAGLYATPPGIDNETTMAHHPACSVAADGLPPIVTMDDINAERAREEYPGEITDPAGRDNPFHPESPEGRAFEAASPPKPKDDTYPDEDDAEWQEDERIVGDEDKSEEDEGDVLRTKEELEDHEQELAGIRSVADRI